MAAAFAFAAGTVLVGLLATCACATDASPQPQPQALAPNQTAPPIALPADLPVLPEFSRVGWTLCYWRSTLRICGPSTPRIARP